MTVLVHLEWPERCFRVNDGDLDYLRSLLPPDAVLRRVTTESEFLSALPEATVALCWRFRAEWYALAPRLELVATPAAGRELVEPPPPPAADLPRKAVVHFGGYHGEIISETVLGFILAWAHGFFRELPLWPRSILAEEIGALHGSRAVILGYGRIGRAIGARLAAFGVEIFGYSRHLGVTDAQLDEELRRADWVVLALPSDTGTDDFLDARRLALLPRRAVVVNIGRGNAIDERALLGALRRGEIAAAYLDVFKNEPTVLNPEGLKRAGEDAAWDLANLPAAELPPNLIRTPHAAAFSSRYMRLCFKELKDEGLL